MKYLALAALVLTLAIPAAAAPAIPAAAAPPTASAIDVPSDEPPTDLPAALTTDDVLAMMDKAPAHELGKTPHKWSREGQANRIAAAIAKVAQSRDEAGDLVVFDLFESNNRLAAVGDHGLSHGPWQLSTKRAPPEVARDPEKAAAIWLSLAAQSRKDCAKLPEDDQLAEVASGSCQYGRVLARRRAALRRLVVAMPDPE
jgi:hypothetical protein